MDAKARAVLAARVLERSHADATEVILTTQRRALTRFTHEFIHQNVDVDEIRVRVRAVVDGRTGVAETNRSDDSALDDVVERARTIASFAPHDDDAPPLAEAHALPPAPAKAHVTATASTDAERRAAIARAIFDQAERNACWSSGYVTTSEGGVTIATSRGALASFDGTDAGANVKMTAANSTGFAERYASDASVLDGEALGARAATKARASADPVAVEPGEWTVILEPPAFGELVAFLASHFSAQSYDEGSSFLSERLGETVMGTNVTIRDDYAHPLHPDMPFDWEASPKQRIAIVENGVARTVVTDRRWSAKLALPNTGHGLPAPNGDGPYPLNLTIDPGTTSLDDLIASTKRGLLVTRLWYTRVVDQRKTILTGMTRDGTFLIENGIVGRGVRNLRFNQSLVDALGACAFADTPARTGGYSYGCVVPAVKFERFTFASTTDY
jgi:predicted Zn-dependent protease